MRTKEQAREVLLKSRVEQWTECHNPNGGTALTEVFSFRDERYYLGTDNRIYCYNIDHDRWEQMEEAVR